MLKTGRCIDPINNSQVHIIEREIYHGRKTWRGHCNRLKHARMKVTNETVTCPACLGLIKQNALPKVEE